MEATSSVNFARTLSRSSASVRSMSMTLPRLVLRSTKAAALTVAWRWPGMRYDSARRTVAMRSELELAIELPGTHSENGGRLCGLGQL